MITGLWCAREFEKHFFTMFLSIVFGNTREGINMANNPDVYLLYEYMKKNAFTVRMKGRIMCCSRMTGQSLFYRRKMTVCC